MISRRDCLKRLGQGSAAVLTGTNSAALAGLRGRRGAGVQPNIIFFLVDDLGWSDLGYQGAALYDSPATDSLLAKSMRFTQGYAAAPMCSPTRASIITGQYPARLNLTAILPPRSFKNKPLETPEYRSFLPLEETSIAEQLSAVGYETAAIGKWHLGEEGYMADAQGFDTAIGATPWGNLKRGNCGFFSPYCIPGFEDDPEGFYLTDRLTDEAEKWIEAKKDTPFFLYMSHYAVHEPIQAKAPMVEEQRNKNVDNPKYGAMIQSVDESLARLKKKVEDLGIADNTIIIYFSDNGGWLRETSNAPLREGKGWLYEGGVRVPMFVHWPSVTDHGPVSETPVTSVDFYPTILELAGVTNPIAYPADGKSFVPELLGNEYTRGSLYWHYPHYNGAHGVPSGAIRKGDFKLIEFFENGGTFELYNIVDDPGETNNIIEANPQIAQEMKDELKDWRAEVGAKMPGSDTTSVGSFEPLSNKFIPSEGKRVLFPSDGVLQIQAQKGVRAVEVYQLDGKRIGRKATNMESSPITIQLPNSPRNPKLVIVRFIM